MSDRYGDEIREMGRFIAWLERYTGRAIEDDSGVMTAERHWHFNDIDVDRAWVIWASATGFRE